MLFFKKIVLVFMLLFLASCAARKPAPGDLAGSAGLSHGAPRSFTKKIITNSALPDPELALKTALDAYKTGNYDGALLVSREITDQYPDTVWYRRALFVTEEVLIRLDQASAADAAMLRVQEEYPELADYAVFLLAEYHYSRARYSKAAALYQVVLEQRPKSLLAAQAAYRRGLALSASNAYPQAIDAFEKFLEDYPGDDLAPDAGLGLARALIAAAQPERAVLAFRDIWTNYPGTPADKEVEQGLTDLKKSGVDVPDFTANELYERGKNLFLSNQYDKAAKTFLNLLDREPSYPNRADAQFRAGVSLFNIGKRAEAAAILEKMARENPAGPRTPEALYWAGKSCSKLGDWDRAVKNFHKLLDTYPDSDWADDALFHMGNIFREEGDMKNALQYYGRLVQEYPDSRFADSAIWWKAWSFYAVGEYNKAGQAMRELVTRYPRSFLVNQALYWQGRAAEKQGDFSGAIGFYELVLKRGPYTYYGNCAAERKARLAAAGTALTTADTVTVEVIPACAGLPCAEDPANFFETDDGPPVWTDETKRILSTDPSFRKTLELMQLDMKKEAAKELWALQDRLPRKRGMLLGLSKAFFELGDYHNSLLLVLRNYKRYLEAPSTGITDDLWLLAYPQGYWDSIVTYSRKYGQDPFFIAAVIREESQFRTEALSPAGARGLMQVMPATGKRAAQLIKLRGFARAKLFDSDTAINIGTWYLSRLMKRFKGDPLLVAAAYNAGPEAVASWLAKNEYHGERDAFVEDIPFSETRGYVKKVLRNYAEYKRIYSKPTGSAPLVQRQAVGAGGDDGVQGLRNP